MQTSHRLTEEQVGVRASIYQPTPNQLEKLAMLLTSTFSPGELDMLLFEKLNVRRTKIIERGAFIPVCRAVVHWFLANNRIDDLINCVVEARPRRGDVKAFAQRIAANADGGLSIEDEVEPTPVESEKKVSIYRPTLDQLEELTKLLTSAFRPGELDFELYEKAAFKRINVIEDAPFIPLCRAVVHWFHDNNRIDDLINCVVEAKPYRADIKDFAQRIAANTI